MAVRLYSRARVYICVAVHRYLTCSRVAHSPLSKEKKKKEQHVIENNKEVSKYNALRAATRSRATVMMDVVCVYSPGLSPSDSPSLPEPLLPR